MPINGKPMIEQLIDRLAPCKDLNSIVVATGASQNDDAIAQFCKRKGVFCFRGDDQDVLQRLHGAAQGSDRSVVLMGDSPLVNAKLVSDVLKLPEDHYCSSFTATIQVAAPQEERGFPVGIWAQALPTSWLDKAVREANQDYHRLHATTYFFTQPQYFPAKLLLADAEWVDARGLDYFLAVNTLEEFERIRLIFESLGDDCSIEEAVSFTKRIEN